MLRLSATYLCLTNSHTFFCKLDSSLSREICIPRNKRFLPAQIWQKAEICRKLAVCVASRVTRIESLVSNVGFLTHIPRPPYNKRNTLQPRVYTHTHTCRPCAAHDTHIAEYLAFSTRVKSVILAPRSSNPRGKRHACDYCPEDRVASSSRSRGDLLYNNKSLLHKIELTFRHSERAGFVALVGRRDEGIKCHIRGGAPRRCFLRCLASARRHGNRNL